MSERVMVPYRLPDGRIVKVDRSAAKGAWEIDFTLRGGRIVKATRVDDGCCPVCGRLVGDWGCVTAGCPEN